MGSHLLITGGSKGIGEAVVRAAVARGDRVTFTYARDATAAQALVDELGAAVGAVRADARDTDDVVSVFSQATCARGNIDVLVNNAGVTGSLATFMQADESEVRAVFELNVFATMAHSRVAARRWLKEQQAGVIVT